MRIAAAFTLLLVAAGGAAGCGKKGPPLPPLMRVPGLVGDASATRIENDVFVRFIVPSANADGEKPANIARVEVFALTATRPPGDQDDPATLRRLATLVATEQVRRPLPPPAPPAEAGAAAVPPLPVEAGVDQGSEVVVRDTLTPDMHKPIELPVLPGARRDDQSEDYPHALVAPQESGAPVRYYFAAGVNRSGRYGPIGPIMAVPLGTTSGAPGQPELAHDANTITIRWLPPPDARGLGLAETPGALPATPILQGPPPTTYDVYESTGNKSAQVPVPLTSAPIGATALAQPVGAFGVERCFFVRSVDIVDGHHVRGPASPVACLTPKDTFPPTPPRSLAAVSTEGAINLIWEPSESSDVAGYLVLRARLPDDTLQPANDAALTGTTFIDKGVRPGITYAYVVIAVDRFGNRSEPSNRVEETAR